MERLPDELVLLILRLLPARALLGAGQVCRRWERLVGAVAVQLRRRGEEGRVTRRTTVLIVTATYVTLATTLRDATQLTHLTVHEGAALTAHEMELLQRLRRLRHLDVFSRERPLRADAQLLQRCTTFVLNDAPRRQLLRALAHGRLDALHMYGRSFYYSRSELLSVLTVRRTHLRELTLRCAELRRREYEAIGACENLVDLRLYSCWMLTGEAALQLCRPTALRVLHVTCARMVRAGALGTLLDHLPASIRELVLSSSWFGDAHVPLLVARLPQLRVLELWRCPLSARGAAALLCGLSELRDFDSDVSLSRSDLEALSPPSSLQRLRACLPRDPPPLLPAGVLVRCASRGVARRFVRGCGEGFRADLFYFWSRDLELPAPPTSFYDDDDSDCDDLTAFAQHS